MTVPDETTPNAASTSPLGQLVAIEDTVLDFEADVLADKLIYVRVSLVQTFIDALLDAIWEAQHDHRYVIGSEAIGPAMQTPDRNAASSRA